MKKIIKQRRQTILLATIATIFILGAFALTYAHEGKNDNNFLRFDYLSSNTSKNLRINIAPDKFGFINVQSNPLAVNFKSAVEYPKPDFSGIEKWYEIVSYEYGDFEGGKNELDFWLKPKNDARPDFTVAYYDKDGVLVGGAHWACFCEGSCYVNAPIGTVQKWSAGAPAETQMKSVKTVKITRNEN